MQIPDNAETFLAKVDTKGRVVIDAEIRSKLKLSHKTRIRAWVVKDK